MFFSPRVATLGPQPRGSSTRSPSSVAADTADSADQTQTELCFHCAAPIATGARWTLMVDGADRAFCCAGCRGIAQTIHAAGLAEFYLRRAQRAQTPSDAPDEWTQYDIVAEAQGLIARVDGTSEISLLIEGIRCAACVWLIETYVGRLPGVVAFDVNFATQRAHLRWSERALRLSEVLRAISSVGYRAYPYDPARREALSRREGRALFTRMAIALLAMMQVMMFSIPAYISVDGVEAAHERLLDWAGLMLSLPVMFYSAMPFFKGALRDLRLGRLGMDVPVALGVGAAFIASARATLAGEGAVYFDSVTMFVALLLLARYVEFKARQKAGAAIEAVARERPQTAERLPCYPEDGPTECIAASQLRCGDVIRIAAGAPVPADGEVLAGRSSVEEAILTGESWPRTKTSGASVLAGSVNRESPLLMRVSASGEATTAAALAHLVERVANDKPRVARLADRAATWFVSGLLLIAAVTALVWTEIDPARVLLVSFAVLVVSCPCALSLATPAALAVAAGALGRNGILAVRPNALEALSRVTQVVIDKTGTLTTGKLQLRDIRILGGLGREECLAIAAAIEHGSAHPIAAALSTAGGLRAIAQGVVAVSGEGVEGTVGGRRYRCGRPAWVGALHGRALPAAAGASDADAIPVALGDESGWLAWLTFGDTLRAGASEFVATLRAMGIGVSLASGDRTVSVERVAKATGIERWQGEVAPEAKRASVAAAQRGGAVVAMIGDGINDAPSLAQADVSLSLGSATALTQWTADIVVLGDDLRDMGVAFGAARRTFRVIRQNLAWALAYNAIAIPLAATGQLTPLVAALGMSVSSILVVANASRLARIGGAWPRGGNPRARPASAAGRG